MRDDHDEFMTASLTNERMQVEAERIAWSRLPLGKKIWYGLKRFINLKDSWPFPEWHIRSRVDKIFAILSVVTAIAVVILLCYVLYWTIVILSIVDGIGAL